MKNVAGYLNRQEQNYVKLSPENAHNQMNFHVVAIFLILLSSVCASFIPYFGENQRKPRLNFGPTLNDIEKRNAWILREMQMWK
ncbi:hypothetical protein Y032_0690g1565 [Ancylostoma ceylanicum]|uniref:Uncharacterized protein n=1 Tax=Ancylostoma ceylanicum TaxID=53326 RepID=A0A016WHU1_9BILA|nr:hypothetical protein Y032_0690g1565 [Ancylostoma ceylanicum]